MCLSSYLEARQYRAWPRTATSHPRSSHSFATRVLEQCGTRREAVARHFFALSTYLGHADIAHTYWYLEATREQMADIAAAAEKLVVEAAP
jgi:integrase